MTAAANDKHPTRDRALATLFVSYACPWSHRVLIARALSDLENVVDVIEVEPEMDGVGWRLEGGHLIDSYREFEPNYSGKATVPLMVDLQTSRIVSNESADLMRLLGTGMSGVRAPLFPQGRSVDCEAWNTRLQHDINKRVYQFGFAPTQKQRANKTAALVEALSNIDNHLAERRFLVSEERPLEPDWRLWSTLARYDLAYRPFLLSDDAPPLLIFENVSRFFEALLAVPGIAATYRPDEIVSHYSARLRDLTTPLKLERTLP